ncbi:hypothetical protein MTR67_052255 [Solanum verrucosum]|uniref:Uncharacterized protein n=1 Tax=Solanum verrucosum TaxID=315347 RepID=A0AAF0V5E8_SOLVR|nr:hypothetical protein MTR67_052255 [Solanum verrucosum]
MCSLTIGAFNMCSPLKS